MTIIARIIGSIILRVRAEFQKRDSALLFVRAKTIINSMEYISYTFK